MSKNNEVMIKYIKNIPVEKELILKLECYEDEVCLIGKVSDQDSDVKLWSMEQDENGWYVQEAYTDISLEDIFGD